MPTDAVEREQQAHMTELQKEAAVFIRKTMNPKAVQI